ncbi:MAG: acyl carrier protein [Okeania sp. SIO2F4]|nr:acyl carrier protein [Okeania sp. SIO2F4]
MFVEIGPKPVLLGMGRECLMGTEGQKLWLPSLRSRKPDWLQILESLGQLHLQGVEINWLGFDGDYSRQKVVLPTYPWQRRRYWITDIKQYKKFLVSEPQKVQQQVQSKVSEPQKVQQQVQSNGKSNSEKVKIRLPSLNMVSTPKANIQERPKRKLTVKSTAKSKMTPQENLQPVTSLKSKIETSNISTATSIKNMDMDINQIKETLKEKLAEALYVEPSEIIEDQKFIDSGLDSIIGVEWITAINRHYGLDIKATKLYDYPTLLELTNYIAETLQKQEQVPVETPQVKTETQESVSDSEEKLKEELRSILNRVAKKELSAQEANQMIQELKEQLKKKGKKQEVSQPLKHEPQNGGQKEKVLQLIIKYTREVAPELEKVPLGATHSLKNLGIDSASRAEIIMMIMEDLSLNVPRIELAGANNIGELAEIFAAKL